MQEKLSVKELNIVLRKLQNKEKLPVLGTFSEVDIVFVAGLFLWYKQNEKNWTKIPTSIKIDKRETNISRNLPNNRKRKLTENIPHEKSLSSYPATLIGRLGVDKAFGGKGIGTELIKIIKQWMLRPDNLTACRYLTVDAYNNDPTLKFYEANSFKTIFSTETQEKEYVGLPPEKELKTRLMYFDLMLLK